MTFEQWYEQNKSLKKWRELYEEEALGAALARIWSGGEEVAMVERYVEKVKTQRKRNF